MRELVFSMMRKIPIMTTLDSGSRNWSQKTDVSAEQPPVILSASSGADVSLGALSFVSDSLRVLSAFAWGKESRLSKNKSAQLCDLMNAWN